MILVCVQFIGAQRKRERTTLRRETHGEKEKGNDKKIEEEGRSR